MKRNEMFHVSHECRQEDRETDAMLNIARHSDPTYKFDVTNLNHKIYQASQLRKETELTHAIQLIQEGLQIIEEMSHQYVVMTGEHLHNHEQAEKEDVKIPPYLTTRDVAFLDGLSPQMIRKKCQDGDIVTAYRTSGQGSWRIPTEAYRNHPMFPELLRRKQHEQKSSEATVNIFSNLLDRNDRIFR